MSDTEPVLVGAPLRRHAAARQRRPTNRRTPAKGVHISLGGPNWIFLTVCTEKRERWLAQASVQRALHDIWKNTATAWLVSDYLLMPDHLHLFCAPHDLKFTVERWIGFWKDRFAKVRPDAGTFQAGGFQPPVWCGCQDAPLKN